MAAPQPASVVAAFAWPRVRSSAGSSGASPPLSNAAKGVRDTPRTPQAALPRRHRVADPQEGPGDPQVLWRWRTASCPAWFTLCAWRCVPRETSWVRLLLYQDTLKIHLLLLAPLCAASRLWVWRGDLYFCKAQEIFPIPVVSPMKSVLAVAAGTGTVPGADRSKWMAGVVAEAQRARAVLRVEILA